MTRQHWPLLILVSALLVSTSTQPHHSYTPFDDTKTVEIEGKLVAVGWHNPHVRLKVEVASAAGPVTWDIETSGVNLLRRMQVPLEAYKVGSTVKIAGWPAKRSPTQMFGTNILSSSGQETVLFRAQPRWGKTAHGYGSITDRIIDASAKIPDTMFHVWATPPNATDRNKWVSVSKGPDGKELDTPLALTEVARRAVAEFDPVEETTTPGCTPKGMPFIMANPAPLELVDRKNTILLRMEEYDTVRTIHMNATAGKEPPKSLLGYSTGHWEGNALVIDTIATNGSYLNTTGIPLGAGARLTERFTLSADRSWLEYELTVTDPKMLLQPARLKRTWMWRPGEKMLPFNCNVQPATKQ